MNKKLITVLVLAAFATACDSGSMQRDRRFTQSHRNLASMGNARLGAVLTIVDNAPRTDGGMFGPGHQAPSETGQFGPGHTGTPGQSSGGFLDTRSLENPGKSGRLRTIAFSENAGAFFYPEMNTARPSTYSGGGVVGRPAQPYVPLSGLSDKSELTYTSDGGLALVTLTERNEVQVVESYGKGVLDVPYYQIPVDRKPTQIVTAMTRNYGEIVAVLTETGISFLGIDQVNAATGHGRPRPYRHRMQPEIGGQPTAIAFSPQGEYLFIAVNQLPNARNTIGSLIHVCHVGYMIGMAEDPFLSFHRGGSMRGCFKGNPVGIVDARAPSMLRGPGIGAQSVQGIVTRLAVSPEIAAYLTPTDGPGRLITPDIGDMDDYVNSFLPRGPAAQFSWLRQTTTPGSHDARDLAVHPISKNLIALERNRIVTYSTDNAYAYGDVDDTVPIGGGDLVALGMDPGPNPTFLLVADKAARRVLVGTLDARGVRAPNTNEDFIQIADGEYPIDVAVRPNYTFNPFEMQSASPPAR